MFDDGRPPAEPDDARRLDAWILGAAKIGVFAVVVLAYLFGWYRILIPMLWEQGDGGHVIAIIAIAVGIVGLALIALLGRRILVPTKTPKSKDRP